LEDLPNELFYQLFDIMSIKEVHNAFYELNSRINNLLETWKNLSLIFDENNDPSLISLYEGQINTLTIDTSNECNLSQFTNLRRLILRDRNPNHIAQIEGDILSKIVYLSFILKSDFEVPVQLVNDIFSNRFSSLRHVDLGRIDEFICKSWSTSVSLKFVSVRCNKTMVIKNILLSCPKLSHLQFHQLYNINLSVIRSTSLNHPLQRFTIWSDYVKLPFDLIDGLLTYIPNVRHLYIQTELRTPFLELAHLLIDRLEYLSRVDCFVKELLEVNARIGDINTIYKIHRCFNRIECIKEKDDFRIFATD
jgi:hypothetical protein